MALEFLDTCGNPRLAIFSQMLDLVGQGHHDPREFHQRVIELLRRAFSRQCYVEASTIDLPAGSYQITRALREDDSEAVANRSPWRIEGVPVRCGGVVAELLAGGKPVAVNRLNIPQDDPLFVELGRYRAVIAVPGAGDRCKWVLVFALTEDAFTVEEVATLMLRVNFIGLSLNNLQTLAELRRATAYIQSEVDRIAEIQRALLPAPAANVPGLDMAASWETFDRAGGDSYDFAELTDGRWAFLISDVSGHGPSAAVISAILNAILHTIPSVDGPNAPTPGKVLTFVNAQLCAKRIGHSFVTAFLCVWDPRDRTLLYARAGHNPPMLRRGNQIILLNAVGQIPLAILDDTVYTEHRQSLEPGDVIVLFTDGIVEAFNAEGDMFGDERLVAALLAAKGSAQEILAELLASVRAFIAGSRSRDDATMLVLKVGPAEG
jgi:sigma-B regulation protein RsbU (phosphoserine phosphatase)